MQHRSRNNYKASAIHKFTQAETPRMHLEAEKTGSGSEKAALAEAREKIGVSRFEDWNVQVF